MTIVVGFDDPELSSPALDAGLSVAAAFEEAVVVVFGVRPPGGMGEEFDAHQRAVAELGRAATDHALERCREQGIEATARLVHARPADALVEVADDVDARMIVVRGHETGPIRAALLGSTAHRLLQIAERPVLVV